MKTKTFSLGIFTILVLVVLAGVGSAATLSEWALTTDGSSSNVASGVSAGSFVGGAGISLSFDGSGGRATSWTAGSTAPVTDEYFEITISPTSGKSLTITNLNFLDSRSDTGSANYQVQYSKQSDFSSPVTLTTANVPDTNDHDGSLSGLTIAVNSGETLRIRWYAYGSTSGAGVWRINDGTLNVQGTIADATVPAMTLTQKTAITSTQDGSVEVANTGNTNLNVVMADSGDFNVEFSEDSFALGVGEKKVVTVTPTNLGDVGFGGKSVTITATAGTLVKTFDMNVEGSFCSMGEQGGKLDITNIDINNQGQGKDTTWNLLDTIEIEVDVKNTDSNDKVKDVIVEVGIYDSDGQDVTGDFDFENTDEEQYDLGDLSDKEVDTATFTIKVPADIDDGTYSLVIKAYGDDVGEDEECTATSSDFDETKYQRIKIERESDEGKFIAFDNIVISPSEATCGDVVTITADVWNVGDEDQDQVKINIFSKDLQVNDFVEIKSDMNQGDREHVTFEFVVPQGLIDKSYQVSLSADYDYKSGTYRVSLDDDVPVQVKVVGCGVTSGKSASVSATLASEAIAGEDLIVKVIVTNLKNERASFIVGAKGFENWATPKDISTLVDLESKESKEVTLTLGIDKGVSGDKSFVIEVISGEDIQTIPVEVRNIQGAQGSGITGFTGLDLQGNGLIWVIGIINVVLIVLIIIVAVRISRR